MGETQAVKVKTPKPGDRYRIVAKHVQIFGYELRLDRYQEGSPTPYVFSHRECEWHLPASCVQSLD